MRHNRSQKFESGFLTVEIPKNESVMLKSLSGSKLGIWVAHGEGRFEMDSDDKHYNIIARYNHSEYPANPNGSDFDTAGICSDDGRHLAMMPHLERAIFTWQCGYYPAEMKNRDTTAWIDAFVNARNWLLERM